MNDSPSNIPPGARAPLNDDDLTRKDRSYSPSSERETADRQADGYSDDDGVKVAPGTGGPDDSGDVTIPDDTIDAQTIVERSEPSHAPGDA